MVIAIQIYISISVKWPDVMLSKHFRHIVEIKQIYDQMHTSVSINIIWKQEHMYI